MNLLQISKQNSADLVGEMCVNVLDRSLASLQLLPICLRTLLIRLDARVQEKFSQYVESYWVCHVEKHCSAVSSFKLAQNIIMLIFLINV